MKKIFVTMHSLEIGGAERSLIGLLDSLDYSKYEVDLLLYLHQGDFFYLIPNEVNLLPFDDRFSFLMKPIKEAFLSRKMGTVCARLLGKAVSSYYTRLKNFRDGCYISKQYGHKYAQRFLPKINKKYDLAISFLDPHYYVANNVDAKIKMAWLHTDFSIIDVNKKSDLAMWNYFNYIVTVSDSCREPFVKLHPEIAQKTITIENILSPLFVAQQADVDVSKEMPDEDGVIKLCTVGRFSHAKGLDNAVLICKKLVDMGCNVKWYVIGYGGDEPIMRAKIKETGMEDRFIILGKKTNPYPYMKACDIYVQPSRHEGKAVTVREAQMLGKPVVVTKFATASSQLQDGYDGVIVPMDIDECAKGIKIVIEDKSLQQRLIGNTKCSNYGNEKEVDKIYNLIEV